MNTLEGRLRAAYRAAAETVRPDAIRDLAERDIRPVPRRHFRLRTLIPLTAATAVALITILASLAVPAALSSHRGGPRIMPSLTRSGLLGTGKGSPAPPFFIGFGGRVLGKDLGIYSATTGRVVARMPLPAHASYFRGTAATADSRTFIVAAVQRSSSACATMLYRLRLTPRGHVAGLAPLAIPKVAGQILPDNGLSTSADGRVVAYTADGCPGTGNGWLGVINLATGKVSTWPLSFPTLWSLSLSANGQELGFVDTAGYGGRADGEARVLRTDSPPGPLTLRSRVVLSRFLNLGYSGTIALSPSGTVMLACSESSRNGPGPTTLGAYDATTGRMLSWLHRWRRIDSGPCSIALAPTGRYLLVSGIFIGRLGARIDLATGHVTEFGREERSPVGISW